MIKSILLCVVLSLLNIVNGGGGKTMSELRRRLLLMSQPIVPCNWVETTDKTYIDTGFTAFNGCWREVTFAMMKDYSTREGSIVSSHNPANQSYNEYSRNDLGIRLNSIRLNKCESYLGPMKPFVLGQIYTAIGDTVGKKKLFVMDGVTIEDTTTRLTVQPVNNVCLAYGQYSGNICDGIRFYSVKIKDSNYRLVRDYIPVFNRTVGKYGLWDKVERKFYSPLGGGDLLGG